MLLNHLRRRLATSQHAAQRRKIVLQARRRAELEAELASLIGMDQIVAVAVDDVNCAAGSGVLAHTREWPTQVDIYDHNPEWPPVRPHDRSRRPNVRQMWRIRRAVGPTQRARR